MTSIFVYFAQSLNTKREVTREIIIHITPLYKHAPFTKTDYCLHHVSDSGRTQNGSGRDVQFNACHVCREYNDAARNRCDPTTTNCRACSGHILAANGHATPLCSLCPTSVQQCAMFICRFHAHAFYCRTRAALRRLCGVPKPAPRIVQNLM